MTARFDRMRRLLLPRGPAAPYDDDGPPGTEGPGMPGDHRVADDQRGDRFGGAVAVIIALATLLAAVAGLLQAEASELAEDDRLAATGYALQAAASAQRGQQLAQVEYQAYIASVTQATSAGSAQLRSMLAVEGSERERRLLLEHERWQALADASRASSELAQAAELGPEEDPTFPRRYFAAAREESHRLNALQDAHNERANLLDERGAAYTAVLAVLAVSLYLFGLSVAVNGQLLRRMFLAVGLVLTVVAASWTAITAAQGVQPVETEAAAAYAAGRVAAETAHDSAAHAAAEAHFDRAIELRPTFAQAYLGRAEAIILGATPQRSGLISLVPIDALQAAQRDIEQARQLGLATAQVEARAAFYSFVEGIQTDDESALERSAGASRRAIGLDPTEPVYWLNLAVTLLAQERFTDAEHAYRDGARHALHLDGDLQRPRNEPWLEAQWLAGALTDLELLARHQPELAPRVATAKEYLVATIGGGTLEPTTASDARIDEPTLTVFPGLVQWQAHIPDYQPERDVISAQWYHRPPGTEEWAVMPEVSGRLGVTAEAGGGYFQLNRYLGLTVPPRCLPTGEYRLELYLNGRLATTREVVPEFAELEAAVARDITIAYCRPAEWQPVEEQLPGLLHGFRSADDLTGVYGLRFDLPRSFSQLPGLPELMLQSMMESMTDLFPGQPEFIDEAGTTDGYFMGLSQTAWQWYDYGDGWIRAAAGLDDDGAVLIGIVYGPYAWYDTPEPDAVHDSMVRNE